MARQPRRKPSETKDLGIAGLHPTTESEGLSLDRLGEAFAQLLAQGDDPYAPAPDPPPQSAAADETPLPEPIPEPAQVAGEVSPLSILEAMLFVGASDNRPLSSEQVAGLMRGVRAAEVDELVRELNSRYDEDACPYTIAGEGAGYRLILRPEFGRIREKFHGRVRQAALSQQAVDVLSIVAYNQPIAAEAVNKLRGHPSGAILSQLVRRQLLRIERSQEKPRRTTYHTTDRFLQLFGLGSIEELPRSQDLERE